MLGKKLGIDLGSTHTRVITRGAGIVVDEPSVVALGRSGDVVAAGSAALRGSAAVDRLVWPVVGGRIADMPALVALLGHVLNRAAGRQRIFKPETVVVVHGALPGGDRMALLDLLAQQQTRTAYLLDAPLAAAMGAGLTLSGGRGHLVVDVGAECVEVVVLAHEGTVAGRCLATGMRGGARHLVEDVRRRAGVDVPLHTAEVAVAAVASCRQGAGRQTRIPHRDGQATVVASEDMAPWVAALVREIVTALRETLAEMPQSLLGGIVAEGGLLVGGGVGLEDLDVRLSEALGLHLQPAAGARLCAVRGAGMAVDSLDVLRRTVMYMR